MNVLQAIMGPRPVEVSQPYGPTAWSRGAGAYMYAYGKSFCLDGRTHTGWDIGGALGTPLYAPVDGRVMIAGGTPYFVDTRPGYGNRPGTGQLKLGIAGGAELILGHCEQIFVKVGQRVRAGDKVGTVGNNNGPHCHVELRVPDRRCAAGMRILDPVPYFGNLNTPVAPAPQPVPADPTGPAPSPAPGGDTPISVAPGANGDALDRLGAAEQLQGDLANDARAVLVRLLVVVIGMIFVWAGVKRAAGELL